MNHKPSSIEMCLILALIIQMPYVQSAFNPLDEYRTYLPLVIKPPTPPTFIPFLGLPENGANIHDTSVTFKWTISLDTKWYEIQIAKDTGFTLGLISSGNDIGLWGGPIDVGTYYWRVRACLSYSIRVCGDWSSINTFTIRPMVDIYSQSSYVDSLNFIHIDGIVKNYKSTCVTSILVTATFYNKSNVNVGTDDTYSSPSQIKAGYTATFLIIKDNDLMQATRYELNVTWSDPFLGICY